MIIGKATVSNMLWLPRKAIGDELGFIKNDLTFNSYFDTEDSEPTKAYILTKEWLGVPWYYSDKFTRIRTIDLEDKRVDGASSVSFTMLGKPRDTGQKEVIRAIDGAVALGVNGMIVRLDTGGGKTFVGINAIHKIGRPALIVVHKNDIMRQWKNEILEHTNIPEAKIGVGRLGYVDWKGKWVVIALVHTLALNRESKEFKKYFGVVLFDEVDRSVPPHTFSPVAGMFHARYRIALSATPKRADGLHSIFELHLGGTVITPSRDAYVKKMNSVIIVVHYKANKTIKVPSHLNAIVRKALFLKHIAKDQVRNRLVCKLVKRFYNSEGRQICVASKDLLPLHMIRELLISAFSIPVHDIGYYTASAVKTWKGKGKPSMRTVKEAEQQHTKDNCRIVLATIKMIEAGTNIPDMSGCIMATPLRTTKQLRGRIERFKEGKKQPIFIDIVDDSYDDAKGWFNQRMREYNAGRLKIIER